MNVSKLNDDYYYYKEPIGYGSFSIIYKGYSVHSKVPLAIKRITKIIDMKYFYNEVKLMKQLDHPNILKLYDVIKNNGSIYLVLEYCNGGDLSNYISKNNSNLNEIEIYIQIFKGLEYLYDKQILHRDMKPHNLLIHNDTIKISDFGFAKSFEKNELITTFCGSPLYMAPEIVKNKEYNSKSDIWSLGVIIYELFTKKHPYYTDTKQLLWEKIKNGLDIDYTIIDYQEINEILGMMLIEDPEERVDWDVLFKAVHSFDYSIYINTNEELVFTLDEDLEYDNSIAQSVIIPKKKNDNSVSCSINIQDFDNSTILREDDYRIISRSAPNNMSKSYLENYISSQNDDNKTAIPILGNEPLYKSYGINSFMEKSIKTVKNLLNKW